jgi:hypothetical protein
VSELSEADRDALLRWRLALGPGAEEASDLLGLAGLGSAAAALELASEDAAELDDALSFVYDGDRRKGGRPNVPRWLGAVRRFFSQDAVALVQKDAIEKKGLTQLLFEPETMPLLEKNVELVALLLSARGLVPDEARETARQVVREVVDELRKRLESSVRTAVIGALRKDRHSPLKVLRNLDWSRTIRSNLKGWDRERRRLVPERIHFWANQRRRHEWDVVLVVDQSGSMARSCVYASVMGAIFASLDVLRTRMVLYDTEVVDVSDVLSDPVDILFTAQLGGGNDGKRALAYVQERYVDRPEKTIFLWITDLGEPATDFDEIVARMRALVDAKVKAFVLLALDEGGKPWYDHELARRLTEIGVLCFGCTPNRLVEVMERALKGQDVASLVSVAKA